MSGLFVYSSPLFVFLKDLQEALGHHTAAFTLDVYAHVGEQRKRESAARMEEFIKSVSKSGKKLLRVFARFQAQKGTL
jgi:hypothetical protein